MIPLKDANPVLRFPFWIFVIILINAFVFYLELTAVNPESFILKYALIPSLVNFLNFETLAPFISSQFLHAGFLHIISNILFLWVFGNNIEAYLGFLFFPIFYLASGIIAGLTQYVITPNDSIPILGASGAVAGVLGAYLALFPYHKIKTLIFIFFFVTIIDVRAYILLLYWFVIQYFSGVLSIATRSAEEGGIAFLPHVGGFLFGFLISLLFFRRKDFIHFKSYS